jgi:hypothetical protein
VRKFALILMMKIELIILHTRKSRIINTIGKKTAYYHHHYYYYRHIFNKKCLKSIWWVLYVWVSDFSPLKYVFSFPIIIIIIIINNEKRTCVLIDVAISGDRNVIKKEAEKILKYKDLTLEIQRMWNVKQRWFQ